MYIDIYDICIYIYDILIYLVLRRPLFCFWCYHFYGDDGDDDADDDYNIGLNSLLLTVGLPTAWR